MFTKHSALTLFLLYRLINADHNVTVVPSANTGSNAVGYAGGDWEGYTACGGTYYTDTAGAYMTFNYTGTDLYLIGTNDNWGGVSSFTLDGNSFEYDRYINSTAYLCGITLAAWKNQAYGPHTLTITLLRNTTGVSGVNQTGYFEWQEILYTVPDSTSSSSTTSSTSAVPTIIVKNAHTGAIVGGVVGGILGLAIIAGALLLLWRRKRPSSASAAALAPNSNVRTQSGRDELPLSSFGHGKELYSPALSPTVVNEGGVMKYPSDESNGGMYSPPTVAHSFPSPSLNPQDSAGARMSNITNPGDQPAGVSVQLYGGAASMYNQHLNQTPPRVSALYNESMPGPQG